MRIGVFFTGRTSRGKAPRSFRGHYTTFRAGIQRSCLRFKSRARPLSRLYVLHTAPAVRMQRRQEYAAGKLAVERDFFPVHSAAVITHTGIPGAAPLFDNRAHQHLALRLFYRKVFSGVIAESKLRPGDHHGAVAVLLFREFYGGIPGTLLCCGDAHGWILFQKFLFPGGVVVEIGRDLLSVQPHDGPYKP